MKIMVGICHPKQVHFWKNILNNLIDNGHKIKIVAWEKDIALNLLSAYGFEYDVIGKNYKELTRKACGMIKSTTKLLKIAKEFKPDILLAGSPSLAHVSKLIGRPHVDLSDTEHATLAMGLSLPFTSVLITPSCFKRRFNPKKHITFNGYFELAYLHPNYFKPDPKILDRLGIDRKDRFVILRLVSWHAAHDLGEKGFDAITIDEFVEKLQKHTKVFITSERTLNDKLRKYRLSIPPTDIHSVLYYATAYIGESPTMTTESAILGTPAICISSWACDCGNLLDLHKNYRLVYCFGEQNQAINFALNLLEDSNLKRKWKKKRDKLLREKVDVTEFMTNLIENFKWDQKDGCEC